MEGGDVHIQQVAIFIADAHRLPRAAVHIYFLQAAVNAHAMIDMRHVIAGLHSW